MRSPLTGPASCGDTALSLKSLAAPRRLAVKPDFFRPHSVRRARARLARSMGDAGTRKGPAAPTCGETSPTPFRVVAQTLKRWRHHA